ncbi:3-deoxy-D-manno-octulosonic-acid transferase [Kingella potus]|uniref:3-deoxy-D-manno-octulosonic acid transferase n=1 Tax=Kingella potus TaxID=265175 RepID=A0A377QZV4_9NEIS|nr:lipid IV(A) 3-deoxy-D-manno-octulosonic acid transferase [Kingella potus]UOP01316.1 lipid IV(A) 3-deoxy-D-manno-octulosonic acid transferase [Kingella potus]STR00369.1 3-deoxy-D-manno-octulosonic-acid transferase [Kingella potus]
MLAWIYRQLWRAAPPLIRRYLRRRARGNPAYLEHWDERFGRPHPAPVRHPIWIHAVSVGETRAAAPLAAALRRRFPDAPLLFTQMTPTGRAAAESLYPDAQCRYLPYDKPEYAARFLAEHRPRFGVLMETEIWPHLAAACARENVPLFLANARLSEKSLRGYRRAAALVRPALQSLRGCYAQSEADAGRLKSLGAACPVVCGNTKYDLAPPPAQLALGAQFRAQAGGRKIIVCGSTRFYHGEDEAALLLHAWRRYGGNALLVIVPRHPERFDAVFQTALSLGLRIRRRSGGGGIGDAQVWLGDSMGELYAYYAMADAAFVGGSLVDAGCQNIIEPLACGKPVLFGFSTYNFSAACTEAQAAGAARQVADADEWLRTVQEWLDDDALRTSFAANAAAFVARHRGASEKTADLIAEAV